MADWFDKLSTLVQEKIVETTRPGFYVGKVTNALETFRRAAVEPEWIEDNSSLERLVRISSPILDVIYKTGTRVAVTSQDGIPEAGAIFGAVTDDKQEPTAHSVWIRADLEQHDGQIEIGSTKGVRLFVGSNPGELTPVATDTAVIDASLVEVGGESLAHWIARADKVMAKLNADIAVYNEHTHAQITPLIPIAASPTAGPVGQMTPVAAEADLGCTNVKGK